MRWRRVHAESSRHCPTVRLGDPNAGGATGASLLVTCATVVRRFSEPKPLAH